MIKLSYKLRTAIMLTPLLTLTGCPDHGIMMKFDETTSVTKTTDGMCFQVPDAQDYQPGMITIAPRGTPSDKRWYKYKPDLKVQNGQLCVPPSLYTFPYSGQFLVEYTLISKTKKDDPRRVVIGFDLNNGHPYGIELTNIEISRPYRSEDE
jgi:hypothetical protein